MEGNLSPSVFETLNARHKSPREVAASFVPPINEFTDLVSRNNHIIVGPRGSGKTTLLKMLTIPALTTWNADSTRFIIPKTDFIGVFIPADRVWHEQLKLAEYSSKETGVSIGRVAFTTHVLLSFSQAIKDLISIEKNKETSLSYMPPTISIETEQSLVKILADAWYLSPRVDSIGGLIISLRERLLKLGEFVEASREGRNDISRDLQKLPYLNLQFISCISHAIEVYEELSGSIETYWALLFDEFEVAPSSIQIEVMNKLRGLSETRILFKIALAPYNKNLIESNIDTDIDATPKHDYEVIELWYPGKEQSYDFSKNLVLKLLEDQGIDENNLNHVLGPSHHVFSDADSDGPYEKSGVVSRAVISLSDKDVSFREYLDKHNIDLSNWPNMTESKRAVVRKMRTIVVSREYYLREFSSDSNVGLGRSRKIDVLYTGHPILMALCEGNPRLVIGIMAPIVREYILLRQSNHKKGVPARFQAEQIRAASNANRSLLKTIPYEGFTPAKGRGLLDLLDLIGNYFFDRCMKQAFSPEPPLTFTIPSNASPESLKAIGRGLNAGALIYVPDIDADPILSSLRGKRFRLSYLLCAHYRLPILLGGEVSLSTILNNKSSGEIDLLTDVEN